jgi:HD-GYP domain-containing protein (c-di-GMP phosphodiesterase class II)
MTLHCKQSRANKEKKIRDLEDEIRRLKQREQAAHASLKTAQAELRKNSDRLRKNMGGIIQAMSLTIEKRDPYTAGHQRRVTKLCRAIATEMRFSWERIQGFRMAAVIHDLGKIQVPAAILSKPGKLTENEFGIIKTHPQVGFDILKGIEFSWPIAQIIHQHHERMDGSGYPRGLCGDDILMEARILAVADVVEAMSSHRPYRPALGLKKAIAEIRLQKGVLYDAEVVEACLKVLAEKKSLFKNQ